MDSELWEILKSQPGIGVVVGDSEGRVLYANDEARRIYYGSADVDPIGKTIEELEGPEFAAERMGVLKEVLETRQPRSIRHIRGGRWTEATIWPLQCRREPQSRFLVLTRQGVDAQDADSPVPVFESKLVDLGPLDILTRRELEVLVLIGHGTPLKTIAQELAVSQRTVERYRTEIARKLRVNTIAEIAQIVQRAGLEVAHADLPRLRRWQES